MISDKLRGKFAVISIAAVTTTLAMSKTALGHGGGVLVYLQNGRIVTGLDSNELQMDIRASSILLATEFWAEAPSFHSSASPPPNLDPLPQGTALHWDFLPMTVDGHTSTLLYWNGEGAALDDVAFGAIPHPNVTMGLYNVTDGVSGIIGEADQLVPGALIATTDTVGSLQRLHGHLWSYLDDGSDATDPPAGIYLFAIQLRMDGCATSLPFYLAAGTSGMLTPLNSLAMPWINDHVNTLILDADFDFDGDVDGDDFLIWQSHFGTQAGASRMEGDTDGDADVDGDDFLAWQSQFGTGPTGIGSTTVLPEPATGTLMLSCAVAGIGLTMRSSRRQRQGCDR